VDLAGYLGWIALAPFGLHPFPFAWIALCCPGLRCHGTLPTGSHCCQLGCCPVVDSPLHLPRFPVGWLDLDYVGHVGLVRCPLRVTLVGYDVTHALHTCSALGLHTFSYLYTPHTHWFTLWLGWLDCLCLHVVPRLFGLVRCQLPIYTGYTTRPSPHLRYRIAPVTLLPLIAPLPLPLQLHLRCLGLQLLGWITHVGGYTVAPHRLPTFYHSSSL